MAVYVHKYLCDIYARDTHASSPLSRRSRPMLRYAIFASLATAALAQEQFDCIGNAPQLLGFCGPELEYAGTILKLNETAPATPEELTTLLSTWQENSLPSAACCETVRQFVVAQCICDQTLRSLLPSVSIQVDPIESMLATVAEGCGTFEPVPCST
jgi:hypothetical protein